MNYFENQFKIEAISRLKPFKLILIILFSDNFVHNIKINYNSRDTVSDILHLS